MRTDPELTEPGAKGPARPRKRTEKTYDRLSRWYDLLAEASEKGPRLLGLEKLAVRPGEVALDLGIGTGHALVALTRLVGPAGAVVGIDVSGGMLEAARARATKTGLLDRVRLVHADATRVPLRDGQFDAVFMSFVLELFDTPAIPVVLGECRRVLRENGRICVVSLSRVERPGLMYRAYGWAHRLAPTWVDCRPIDVQASLLLAGFDLVDAANVFTWGLPVAIVTAKKS